MLGHVSLVMENKTPVLKVNGVEVIGEWDDAARSPWVNSIDWKENDVCMECEGAGGWDTQVNAMGKGLVRTQCLRCKGYGHFAR